VLGYSQCKPYDPTRVSKVYTTWTVGGAGTLNIDLSIKIKKLNIGLGYGVMIDDRVENDNGIIYTKNDRAIYGVAGYRLGNLVLGVKAGSRKMIHVTGMVNGVEQHLDDNDGIMVGAYGGVHLSERVRLNLGYDTFNKLNVGVTFGL
jgi:hypothetical protein